MTTRRDEQERLAFAERAARHFAANPDHASFGDVEPGTFLALRWGMGDDCVLVVRLTDEPPVNYQGLVREMMP